MRALVWRIVEWRLARRLPPDRLLPALGDLAEDVVSRERSLGPVRAQLWLLRETRSIVAAYDARRRETGVAGRRSMAVLHLDDVRLAVRRVRKQPLASLASIATLACAIGAAAATWSLLSATLIDPLPVADPSRLLVVGAERVDRDGDISFRSEHIYPLVRIVGDTSAFSHLAAAGTWPLLVEMPGAPPQSGLACFATANFFETVGVRPERGRWFHSDEDHRGAAPVVVVSHRFWRTALGADPGVIGRALRVGDATATIVGIGPRGFRGLNLAAAPDVYLPLHVVGDVANRTTNFFADTTRQESPTSWITIVGRLGADSTAAAVASRLNGIPIEQRQDRTFALMPIATAAIPETAREGMTRFSQLLATTVGLLLLIGCLTVGMLLLIRTEARRDEFAMCLALGASRGRLARGIAVEGALLSVAGAIAAVPVAWMLFGGLTTFQLPGGVDIGLLELSLDVRVILATAAAAVASTLLIAVVAATFGFTANVADVIRSRAGASQRVASRRTHRALVAGQVAVAVVLVAGAGLFARSLIQALRLNPDFETGRVVTASLSLAEHGYTPARATAFFKDVRARLARHAAVTSVSLTQWRGGMTPNGRMTIDGVVRRFPSLVSYTGVDAQYFRTMGMRIIAGRDFTDADATAAPPPIIVSESFGRQLANGGDPIGHRITENSAPIGKPRAVVEIVGVVPDVITNVNVAEPLVMYYPRAEPSSRSRTIVVRAAGDPALAMREVNAAVKAIDPAVTPGPMMTMEDRLLRQLGPQQFGGVVLGALGAIALLLTVLGTYVLAASMAAVRRREIGIRAALGASRVQIGRLLIAETATLVGAGLAAGLLLVWIGAGSIRAFLYRVEPLDVVTLIGVSTTILLLTLAVTLRPAIAAARVDLVGILRED
jgi:predicted permease